MKTSNYWKYGKHENAVSIAGKAPGWYEGREYKKLAPKYHFFMKYKEDGDEESYIESYYKEVLSVLNPREAYKELGRKAILLCWEKPGEFCHRRLVAKWFKDELGIEVEEME